MIAARACSRAPCAPRCCAATTCTDPRTLDQRPMASARTAAARASSARTRCRRRTSTAWPIRSRSSRPQLLCAYPSALETLCRLLQERGRTLAGAGGAHVLGSVEARSLGAGAARCWAAGSPTTTARPSASRSRTRARRASTASCRATRTSNSCRTTASCCRADSRPAPVRDRRHVVLEQPDAAGALSHRRSDPAAGGLGRASSSRSWRWACAPSAACSAASRKSRVPAGRAPHRPRIDSARSRARAAHPGGPGDARRGAHPRRARARIQRATTPRNCSTMRAPGAGRRAARPSRSRNWLERTPRGKTPLIVHRPPVHEALRRAGVEPLLDALSGRFACSNRAGICSDCGACRAPRWRIGWRAACARCRAQFTSTRRCRARDEFAHRPALPAAVRGAVARRADRRRRPRARGPVFSFFDLEDCELGDPPQWNRDPLTHRVAGDAPRHARSTTATSARSATSSICGSRTDICICRRSRRRMRSPETRVTRSASSAQIDSWIEQCPVGRGPNWVQRARARHPADQLEHHLAAARRLARAAVRRRRGRGVPRALAAARSTSRRA